MLRGAGILELSLDLIFAVPDHLNRNWTADLEQALSLDPDHLSFYGLTVEPHTPLGRWAERGEVSEAGEERYEQEFLEAHRTLTAAGFEHYEVSNYGRPGKRARHNSAYWSGAPYLGLGPSAHGFDGRTRRWNRSVYTDWLRVVEQGEDPVAGSETLTAEQREAERVYLGLRTVDGLDIRQNEVETVTAWVREGWAQWRVAPQAGVGAPAGQGPTAHRAAAPRRLALTPEGWLRLDALAAALTSLGSAS
jgi:oxygen-independent coproporphyrinogen-3 oxidase